MFGSLINLAVDTVTAPVRAVGHAVDIIDGLTEGEIRAMAIIRLGAYSANGMAVDELIEWYQSR